MKSHPIVIAAMYLFTSLDDYREIHDPLLTFCQQQNIKGTLLLAQEGINGTVAGSRQAIDALFQYLKKDPRFSELGHKESFAEINPFQRMKVKLKKEIVTLGKSDVDPNKKVGTYVKPKDWNALIADPDVILVDTRNDYEYAVGTFKNAMDPKTNTFREFPDYVKQNLDPKQHKKIAMFCTGGIRCEKASSYLLDQGFEQVFHLQGGILKYLEQVPAEDSLWQGECFVFDDRVTVDHDLECGHYDMCHGCRMPIDEADKQSEKYQPGVSCPHCFDKTSADDKSRFSERQKQLTLKKQRTANKEIPA